ncbi:MAG: hypothetical protein PHS92_04605 [Candidatus Gracilibacteria bacterium]|nr:hypothetical protein [Candidatus Gracilibacteria bacterium]
MKKYSHIIIFLSLSILTLPFYQKGYFLLLDNTFFPKIDFTLNMFFESNFFLFAAIFKALSYIIPSWLIQRLFYIGTLFLLGFGGYKLLENRTKIGAYFAGILMIFNPYVYAHMLDGQIGITAGISTILFFYLFLIRYLDSRRYKDILLSSLFGAFSMMWMSHSMFFIFSGLGIFLIFDYIRNKDIRFSLKSSFIPFVIILALNSNWILGNILGNGGLNQTVGQIGSEHFQAFATGSGKINLYFNTLSLHGFWGERQGRYIQTYFDNDNWKILFSVLFLIVIFGAYSRLRNKANIDKRIDHAFLAIGTVAYILALGISGDNIFAPITQFLYDHMPFYKGLREPQKWVGILLIVYAYFGGYGVDRIYRSSFVQKGYPKIIAAGLLSVPILYTPTMLLGFNGQLFVTDYPKEWYSLNEDFKIRFQDNGKQEKCGYLDKGTSLKCYDVLVLPWHQYIGLKFAKRTIANPSEGFFHNASILQGDNMEMGNIYTQTLRPESRIIEKYIGPKGIFKDSVEDSEMESFIQDLRGLGISEILILKESDYKKYMDIMDIIEKKGKIRAIKDNDRLKLFRVNK